ncbi:MAG: hypothetical protein IBX53_12170 [Halomonas sp.]|nr:hypothetical protein [Halomonas sp.]
MDSSSKNCTPSSRACCSGVESVKSKCRCAAVRTGAATIADANQRSPSTDRMNSTTTIRPMI